MLGRGRGWRGREISPQGMRILEVLRNGREKHSTLIAKEAGQGQANTIATLKVLKRAGLVEDRLEGVGEHQRRETEPGERNKGQRRTYWKITTNGYHAVSA